MRRSRWQVDGLLSFRPESCRRCPGSPGHHSDDDDSDDDHVDGDDDHVDGDDDKGDGDDDNIADVSRH